MTTNELPLEKRIDVDLSNPPVHPEELLYADVIADDQKRPQISLLLGGFDPDYITADFLVDIHDLAEEHDLSLESISVGQNRSLN